MNLKPANSGKANRMNYEQAKRVLMSGYGEFDRSLDQTDPYLNSYPALIEATKVLLRHFAQEAILPIAHLAYGWMPRMLTFTSDQYTNSTLAGASHVDSIASANELITGLNLLPTNNSMVGVSKVLHFINPNFFPIWDSVVARHFDIRSPRLQKDTSIYKDYLLFIHEQSKLTSASQVKTKVKRMFGYEISDVRAVELLLFVVGRDN